MDPDQSDMFFCRDWAFSKVAQCLQHKASKLGGALLVGGVGCGKTALCRELVRPSAPSGRQRSLRARLLAAHFCRAELADSLRPGAFVLSLVEQLSRAGHQLPGYEQRLSAPDVRRALTPVFCDRRPDEALRRAVLFPLLELDAPPQPLLLLVDGLDADGGMRLAQLLASEHHLLPSWLLLVVTARRHSRHVTRLFNGFRKIVLDDLRKSNVIRDLQQYILSRLERESLLRQHLSQETAEMLNQLHIKSNGCMLYMEKVLNGVSEGFILLREIREIPGTLNGLYLWLCQRLFTKKHFHKALPVLNAMLAAYRPLSDEALFECVRLKNVAVTRADFERRLAVLARVTVKLPCGGRVLFHHSFAEWLTDVKYSTQKFLCDASAGHGMVAGWMLQRADRLAPDEVQELASHLCAMSPECDVNELAQLMLWSGAEVETCLQDGQPPDGRILRLLQAAGAESVPLDDDEHDEPLPEAGSSPPLNGTAVNAPAVTDCLRIEHQVDDVDNGLELMSPSEDGPLELSESVSPLRKDRISVELGSPLVETGVEESFSTAPTLDDVDADERESNGVHDPPDPDDGPEREVDALLEDRRPCMSLAARQGQTGLVQQLLLAGADPDGVDADGWTPLRAAAWAGHTDVVSLLLETGARADRADAEQRTALRAAAWGGHEEVVTTLLAAGAAVNHADRQGRTPLLAAAYMGHGEVVQRLLDSGADIDRADLDGRTAIGVAALCASACPSGVRVVELLLERGADVNHQDGEGMTPLLVAAFEGHRDVCELLLEYEADVDHTDALGRCALFAAASMGHCEVVRRLLFWGCYCDAIDPEGRTVLSVAAARGSLSTVRLLLDRGLDETHRDNGGWTPLHYAAYEGHAAVLEALLDAGARPDEVDNEGKHALVLAAQEGHLEAAATLLARGAEPDLRAHDGKTALRMAALEEHAPLVELLVRRGADLQQRDADGRSTLYLLALDCRVPMAARLLAAGADPEARDLQGRTPLHVSSWQGHEPMVRVLLAAGAAPDAEDADRRTAVISAAWQGHAGVVRQLLQHGASVDHVCNQGASALCIAAQEGHVQCVRVLLEHFADPNHTDLYGRSAVKVALKGRHEAVVRLLEQFGAVPGTPGSAPPAPPSCPPSHSNTSMNSTSTAETKPSSAVLASPRRSPASTLDCYTSLGNNSKSTSSTRTGSSTGGRSSPGAGRQQGSMSFTEQLQMYRRRGSCRRSSSPPVSGHQLQLVYADPRDSAESSGPRQPSPPAQHRFSFDQNQHMRIILGSSGGSGERDDKPARRRLAAAANSGIKAAGLGLRARIVAPGKRVVSRVAAAATNNQLRRETPL